MDPATTDSSVNNLYLNERFVNKHGLLCDVDNVLHRVKHWREVVEVAHVHHHGRLHLVQGVSGHHGQIVLEKGTKTTHAKGKNKTKQT
jgi:hypothetical protein